MSSPTTQPAYSGAHPTRALVLLYLSSFLSFAILMCARHEDGDASMGLNMITPIFALVHHLPAIALIHWWRSRPGDFSHNAHGRPPLFREHAAALRALFAVYILATTLSITVFGVYSGQMREVACVRDGRSLQCEDPRQMLCVLAQSVLGFFESAVIGLLWREFRCIAAAVPAEEERLWDEKALPMSAIEPEFTLDSVSTERRPHLIHKDMMV